MSTPVYNRSNIGRTSVGDTSTEILQDRNDSSRPHRARATLYNDGSNMVYLATGAEAEYGKGIPLPPGEGWKMPADDLTYARVNGITESGTTCDIAWEESFK